MARWLLVLGWLLLSFELILRWMHQGLLAPPWIGAGEIVIFGGWAALSAQLFAEFGWRTGAAGFFCAALGAALSGAALLRPEAGAGSAIQNPWAWIHLPSGALGYGFFLLLVFFSILCLVRACVRSDRVASAVAAVSLLTRCRVYPDSRAGLAAILGFSAFLVVSALALWLESLDQRLHAERLVRQPEYAARTARAPEPRTLELILGLDFAFSWAALVAAIHAGGAPISAFQSAWFLFIAALGFFSLLLSFRRGGVEDRLPDLEELDRWSYQCALFAFPWLDD